jgi:uncharacterized protein (DUF2141 family)
MCATVHAHELTVVVDRVKRMEGSLSLALYDSEDGYKNGNPYVTQRVEVSGLIMVISFKDLPTMDYALKLYHDENNNNKLDVGLFGIPIEGYGFSNNGGSFGPASYQDAKFKVNGNTEIAVHLR